MKQLQKKESHLPCLQRHPDLTYMNSYKNKGFSCQEVNNNPTIPPPPFSIKEIQILKSRRMVLWDYSQPSPQSTGFLNKVCIPCPNNQSQFIGLPSSKPQELILCNSSKWLHSLFRMCKCFSRIPLCYRNHINHNNSWSLN